MKIAQLPSFLFALICFGTLQGEPIQVSGIYPSLAMFNEEGEVGTGAVVPWAGSLWIVTYAPHRPSGSTDKLYQITPDLKQIIRPESIGGTPANRMIHSETQQLIIGPHVISADGDVRTIPYSEMFGRPTGNARHLTDPASKILYASMEEGIYEVDLETLAVTELWGDEANDESPLKADLPGYHGKGFYSGQGVYVYANNGEHGEEALANPNTPSGVLAEWDGNADAWTIIRRNQFTEVTGPGGIYGNANPETDPIWTIGWDHRSLIMGVRTPEMGWTFYRLPKASHSYDGAHGWNTEWPRIREIGEEDLLMTMHGTFWRFPKDFGPKSSAGITPRSNYLKVIGDFARWGDRIVIGCDDTARSEFLNKRRAKGEIEAPQSQSNLWFIEPSLLDELGPVIGRGAVWVNDAVAAGEPSDAYLFAGYENRGLHLEHDGDTAVTLQLERDIEGNGEWTQWKSIAVPAAGYHFEAFQPEDQGVWIRLVSETDLDSVTAAFTYRESPSDQGNSAEFAALARGDDPIRGGLMRALGDGSKKLIYAAVDAEGKPLGCYELDSDLNLVPVEADHAEETEKMALAEDVLENDGASIVYTDEYGNRWRLPMAYADYSEHALGNYRVAREVATERDLFNAAGIFYELPARNAGGFSKVRAVATHGTQIHDFASYRGLWVLSGVNPEADVRNDPHVVRSEDGEVALWVGAIDDIWKLGKAVGIGGPWKDSEVKANVASEPYLITGFDRKSLQLETSVPATVLIEIDITGEGHWVRYKALPTDGAKALQYDFPEAFSAYWIRFTVDRDCNASAILTYQ
jgi:hypothetical protein